MKKIAILYLCLALALSLLFGLLAGCGDSAASASDESVQDAVSSEGTASEPEALEETVAAEDVSAENTETSEAESAQSTISYPLEGGYTFDVFLPFEAQLVGNFMNDWYDNKMYQTINEKTGVTLEFVSPSSTAGDEQFSLMVASGDYTDFLNVVDNYEGGAEMALEQGVIVDLTEYVETCAPDYWDKLMNCNEVTQKSAMSDAGQVLAVYGIMNTYIQDSGLMIRKDWLDELGLGVPETTEELYDVMLAFRDAYHPEKTLDMAASTNLDYIVGGFGVSGISLGGTTGATTLGVYIGKDGKTAVSSLQSDGYRSYLAYLTNLYKDGLVDKDFYSETGFGAMSTDVGTGAVGVFRTRSDSIPTMYASVENDDNFELIAVPGIVGNKGDTYEFCEIPTETTTTRMSISSKCEDVEVALQYLNWFYTDDAYLICNYGEAGVSYDYDEDGIPTYTELLTKSDLANLATVRMLYCFQFMPLYLAQDAMYHVASDVENEACEIWGQMGYSQTMPTLTYTTDESSVRATYMTDIVSYAAEVCTTWIIGEAELSDETWNQFQEDLVSLGIDEVMECEQAAFDRYLSK